MQWVCSGWVDLSSQKLDPPQRGKQVHAVNRSGMQSDVSRPEGVILAGRRHQLLHRGVRTPGWVSSCRVSTRHPGLQQESTILWAVGVGVPSNRRQSGNRVNCSSTRPESVSQSSIRSGQARSGQGESARPWENLSESGSGLDSPARRHLYGLPRTTATATGELTRTER